MRFLKYPAITLLFFSLLIISVVRQNHPSIASVHHRHADDGSYVELAPTVTKMPTKARPTAMRTSNPAPDGNEVQVVDDSPIRYWRIGNTGGDNVHIYKSPNQAPLKAWARTTLMVRIGPSVIVDGLIWRNVRDPDYRQGYVRAKYLVATERPPTSTIKTKRPASTPIPGNAATRSARSATGAQAQDLAIQTIKQEPLVLDAAIAQRGNRFSLALVVNRTTNQQRARELGESFVRMLKTFSDDENPGQDIGPGKYDYIITVTYPDETVVAVGGKATISTRISW